MKHNNDLVNVEGLFSLHIYKIMQFLMLSAFCFSTD